MKIINWIKNWNQIDNKCDIDLDNIEYLLDDDIKWKPVIDDGTLLHTSKYNSKIYKKFIIPVGKKSKKEAENDIIEMMGEYHEVITWDNDNGEINIPPLKMQKEYWFS